MSKKWLVFWRVIGCAILLLGAHGLYAYANPHMEGPPAPYKLFLVLDLNIAQINKIIQWMTISAFQSWIVPVAFSVLGIYLVRLKR